MGTRSLAKNVLLVSEILSHVSKLLSRGLPVHVADVPEYLQQGVLHVLGHPDLTTDVDVASLAATQLSVLFSQVKSRNYLIQIS